MNDKNNDYMREYMRKRRAQWRKLGLCPGCGKKPKEGKNYCEECILKGTRRKQANRNKETNENK